MHVAIFSVLISLCVLQASWPLRCNAARSPIEADVMPTSSGDSNFSRQETPHDQAIDKQPSVRSVPQRHSRVSEFRAHTSAEMFRTIRSQITGSHTVSAVKCPAGQYHRRGKCIRCPLGSFRSAADADSSRCIKCMAPYTTIERGSTSADDCIACPAGYGAPRSGASCICAVCPKGTYSASGRAQPCTRCPDGLTTKSPKSTQATDCNVEAPLNPQPSLGRCDVGQFYSQKWRGCQPCPEGSFRGPNSTDDTVCHKCYNSQAYTTPWLWTTTGTDCTVCRPGYGRPGTAPSCVCSICPKNTYSAPGNQPGGSVAPYCVACPNGFITNKAGSKGPGDCYPTDPSTVPTPSAQRDILLEGKQQLIRSGRGLPSWKPGTDMCKWNGITCGDGGLVKEILVAYEVINGALPEAWGKPQLAATLRSVWFMAPREGSRLTTSTFPASWAKMPFLEVLRLTDLNLTGPLPEQLPLNMQQLQLSGNMFTGTVPSRYGKLTLLYDLDLSNNELSGSLPGSLAQLDRLSLLDLSNNGFTGSLPASWGSLRNVYYIRLNNNTLTGSVPEIWSGMLELFGLDISDKQLTQLPGPDFWRSLEYLAEFFGSGNRFSGTLPDYVGQWKPGDSWDGESMKLFDLSNNQFTGPLPSSWQTIEGKDLKVDLSHNQLSGPLPDIWVNVSLLDLSYNRLTGTLPEAWKEWDAVWINLRYNQLTGPLPKGWKDWYAYEYDYIGYVHIYLSGNPINSPLPTEWGDWLGLEMLFIDSSGITGTIPNSWANLTSAGQLRNLALFANPNLEGCLPALGNAKASIVWNINWIGPVTTKDDYPNFKGYQTYKYEGLDVAPTPQDWPPLSGTKITGPCNSSLAAEATRSQPPRPHEP